MPLENRLLVNKEKATLVIAFTLLFTFVGSLIFFAIITAISASKSNGQDEVYKNWLSLFKDSLILVATALTTIIGYYFGQRESSQAYKEAAEAKATLPEAEQVINELKAELEKKVSVTQGSNDSEDFNQITNRQNPK